MASKTQNVRITIDESKLNPYLVDVADMSAKRAAERVAERAQSNAPYRTGKLRSSISARKAPDKAQGLEATYLVGARGVPYAQYQEEGTGPIYPVRARFLRFVPKGGSTFVFARRTRGVPATHFLRDAYATLSLSDYT